MQFKWNQPYLSRVLNLSCGSNSLNSASELSNSEAELYPVILKAQKWQTTFWKSQDQGYFVFGNSSVLLLLVCRMNETNYYKGHRQYSGPSPNCHVSWDTLYLDVVSRFIELQVRLKTLPLKGVTGNVW